MDQTEMSNLYRGPSIDASYQVSYHLAKRFQRKSSFRNQPIRNKNSLWRPCLLTDRAEMSNLNRGPSTDSTYQVSVHLAQRFQRRRLLKIGQSETRPLTFQVCYRHFNKKLRVQLVLCVQTSSLNTLLRMEGNICIIRLKHNQMLLFK